MTLAASAACDEVFEAPGVDTVGNGTALGSSACPVMSSLLKASTSSDPFPPTAAPGMCGTSLDPCSISSRVFLNGFGGGKLECEGALVGTL